MTFQGLFLPREVTTGVAGFWGAEWGQGPLAGLPRGAATRVSQGLVGRASIPAPAAQARSGASQPCLP